jgi:hypothetical protein
MSSTHWGGIAVRFVARLRRGKVARVRVNETWSRPTDICSVVNRIQCTQSNWRRSSSDGVAENLHSCTATTASVDFAIVHHAIGRAPCSGIEGIVTELMRFVALHKVNPATRPHGNFGTATVSMVSVSANFPAGTVACRGASVRLHPCPSSSIEGGRASCQGRAASGLGRSVELTNVLRGRGARIERCDWVRIQFSSTNRTAQTSAKTC